jgi:hypothetical protein
LGHGLSKPISLFGLKLSAGGASIIATPGREKIKMAVAQLHPLRIGGALPLTEDSPSRDEIPQLAHIFLIESCGSFCAGKDVFAARAPAKRGPSFGRKLGPRRRSNTDRFNTTDECCMLCVCISFVTTTCFTKAKTHCRRALFPAF